MVTTQTTGCLKRNGTVFILHITPQPDIRFSNRFFLLKIHENPYANFEYITISVRFFNAEILAKQNGILD